MTVTTPTTAPRLLGTPHRRRGRIVLALILAVLLALFLPPFINVSRYRARIAASMSRALGRPVTVGDIELRLLPQPGFKLENVTIGEDPAFGIEPLLHADEVTADLHLSSLWRGRLEVAKLTFTYPSLNLVRVDGRWNIEALLDRTRSIAAAPTSASRPESRPRFPYIEASGARLNLKLGIEKTVWALSDADFALWSPSEDEWRMRLAARPVRTDSNLGDTGELKLEGRFRRAAKLAETPLELTFRLQKAQLGQLTTLVYGRDRGWRGAAAATVKASGTPAALDLTGEFGVDDFRRYDISLVDNLRLRAKCTAHYSTLDDQFSQLQCQAPVDRGVLTVEGGLEGALHPRAYNLKLSAKAVPVQSFLVLARHAKRDLPEDLLAAGDLNGEFTLQRSSRPDGTLQTSYQGSGNTSPIVLTSTVLQPSLTVPALHFALQNGGRVSVGRIIDLSQQKGGSRTRPTQAATAPARLAFEPFLVQLGGSNPVKAQAWFARDEYQLAIAGDSKIDRLMQVARAFGLPALASNLTGAAKLNLAVAGNWSGFARPLATGSAQVRDITALVTGIASPLKIASAKVLLAPDATSVENLAVGFGNSRVSFSGSLRIPRGCAALSANSAPTFGEPGTECPIEFDLHADQLSTDDLNRLLNPNAASKPWWEVFNIARGSSTPLLARVKASGVVQVNRFAIRTLPLNRLSARLSLDKGVLTLAELRAEVLGGKHSGNWRADFTGNVPAYSGTGMFDHVAMAQLSSLMRDGWSSGNLSANCSATTSGWSAAELLKNTVATADFDWRLGALRHVLLPEAPTGAQRWRGANGSSAPLQFQQMTARVEMRSDSIAISNGEVKGPRNYQLSGTATTARELRLELRNAARIFSVTGPLEKPKITMTTQEAQTTQGSRVVSASR